jgi:hypothetical protein
MRKNSALKFSTTSKVLRIFQSFFVSKKVTQLHKSFMEKNVQRFNAIFMGKKTVELKENKIYPRLRDVNVFFNLKSVSSSELNAVFYVHCLYTTFPNKTANYTPFSNFTTTIY